MSNTQEYNNVSIGLDDLDAKDLGGKSLGKYIHDTEEAIGEVGVAISERISNEIGSGETKKKSSRGSKSDKESSNISAEAIANYIRQHTGQ